MAEIKKDAVWIEIDPNTLSGEQGEAYARYKDYYRAMKTQRQVFEASMSVGVAEGKRMIFGYNFGKLSVAIVADDRKSKTAKVKLSLAEFMAQAEMLGVRT